MGYPKCNSTIERESIQEDAIWKKVQFHHVGLVISAVFGLIAVFMSGYLIWRHCTHYLKPWEQRHIIRVLFMVPIYATVSFLSYLFYKHSIYFEVLRDCYEAFAIASFFALLCHYIAPDLHNQKDYFRGIRPKSWVWPANWFKKCTGGERGWLRTPRSGLTWFNIIWLAVFQYCFVRIFCTIIAVITQSAGYYCLESLNPAFAHVWIMVIEGVCVSIAMYCLIQFYVQLKDDLREHQPLLKVLAIKLVIFLSFWQTILISFLTSTGAIKASGRVTEPDIKIGIPSLLLCIEMAIFSVFHLWAFPWQPYDIRRSAVIAAESAPGFLPDPKTAYGGGPFGYKALLDAFNPWDLVKAVGRGFRWFFVGRRTREQDISYKNSVDHGAGFEPSRYNNSANYNNLSGPWRTDNSFDDGSRKPAPGSIKSPGGRYHPLNAEEDHNHLLSHAQSVPQSHTDETPYPRPMIRHPTPPPNSRTPNARNDLYPDHLPSNPTPAVLSHDAGQSSGVIEPRHLEEEDTGYHGARVSPVPHTQGREHMPAPSYLYQGDVAMPHARGGAGDEAWDGWGGARTERRDHAEGH